MAESGGGSCDVVVLNLERATTCRSRLPRPGRRRSQQLTRSQLTSPVSNNTSTRLKFPQLEMTKRSHCSASSSKIPLPDLTLKTNLSSAEWLKERPKTSIELISATYKKNMTTSNFSSANQRKIQELITRRNSSEDQTMFPRFQTLPAIGLNQMTTWESNNSNVISLQTQESLVTNLDSKSDNLSEIDDSNSELNSDEIPDSANNEPLPHLEQNETMEFDTFARPLIRSDTYDILPTLNEEDCDNSNDFEAELEDSNNDNILSILDTTSTMSDNSDNENENLKEKSSL